MAKIRSSRWWDEPKEDTAECLIRVFRTVHDAAQWRIDADQYHATLYAGGPAAAGVKGMPSADYTYAPSCLPYNICRSATDTLTAKIAQQRPLPTTATQRGSWTAQKRSKKLNQFIEGVFYTQRIFEKKASLIVRDAAIYGRGILAVYEDGEDIVTERVDPRELFYDEWDARYGDPMVVYHFRDADREALKDRFARTASGSYSKRVVEAIDDASRISIGYAGASADEARKTVDRVEFVEAYRLPTKHRPGRHVVATTAGTLIDEEWTQPFPYVELFYNPPLTGMHGQGLVEQLEGYQYEINTMAQKVSDSHHLLGGAWVLVPQGSDIVETHLQNGLGTVVRHKPGLPPQVVQPNPVHPQTYQRLRDLPTDALNDVGISQMSAQSKKPAGITAAVALQTLDDIETERFILFGRAYEAWCLEVSRRLVDCAKRIAERDSDYSVKTLMKGGFVELSWKDVEIDGFELRVFSSSLLPQQPAARLDRLFAFFNAQLIDRDQFMKLLDGLDLQSEFDLKLAPTMAVEERLEFMMEANEEADEDDVYLAPSAYMPLNWGAQRAQQYLDKGDVDGMPESIKSRLRRWILDCQALLEGPQGAAPSDAELAGMGPGPAAPMPAPNAPPVPPMDGAPPMPPGPPGPAPVAA